MMDKYQFLNQQIYLRKKQSNPFGSDLVTNGNMEVGNPPNGWGVGGGAPILSAATDERTGGSGSKSLDVEISAGQTSGGAENTIAINTTIGKTYQVNAWLKNVDLTTGIRVVVFDASYNILAIGETQNGTSWIESQFSFIAATATTILFLQAQGTVGQHGRVDDVSVRQVLNP